MSFILFNFFTKLNPSLHTILYFCFLKKHVLDNFPCRYRFMSLFNSWVILHFTHGSKFIWSIIYYDADKLFFAIFRLINQDLRNTLVISPPLFPMVKFLELNLTYIKGYFLLEFWYMLPNCSLERTCQFSLLPTVYEISGKKKKNFFWCLTK